MSKKTSKVIQTINVVVIKDDIVDMIYSYNEKDKQEAEDRFWKEVKKIHTDLNEEDREDVLNDGYVSIMNASVCLCHSIKGD